MNVSESRIERARWSGSEDDRWFASRLFDKPATYNLWESFHFNLMKKVASNHTPKGQVVELRKAWFVLLQRQALFQHLRESQVTGRDRKTIVSAFHSSIDYSAAVVAEHGTFLRSRSSLLCATYLGSTLMDDARFNAELERYRDGYMEFFALYCDWIVAEENGDEFPLRPLISTMKDDLLHMKARMMTLPVAADRRASRRSFWN